MIQDFFKFPSTPHLVVLGTSPVRNDKVFFDKERNQFLGHELTVEEKIDGANLGISFDHTGRLTPQNRGAYLSAPYSGQWKKLDDWLWPRLEILFDHLHDQYILFGEWCFARHSVGYDKLPDFFLGFDVFDKQNRQFLSFKSRNKLFEDMSILSVPFIRKGVFSLKDLTALMGNSCFGNEPAEGLYLRHDDGRWVGGRAKIVRPEFIQAMDVHWSGKRIIPNQLEYNS